MEEVRKRLEAKSSKPVLVPEALVKAFCDFCHKEKEPATAETA